VAALITASVIVAVSGAGGTEKRAKATWTLVWHDEFNGTAGESPSSAKWTYDIGTGTPPGWGNKELEYYTSSRANSQLDGAGHLDIIARRGVLNPHLRLYRYTSARLKTLGLFAHEYGRFEIRMKIPAGQGLWPAFWMLGNDSPTVGWPNCGEIDVMEAIGKDPDAVYGSIHGPDCTDGCISNRFDATGLTAGNPLAAAFHTYTVTWSPSSISFYLDGHRYAQNGLADMPKGSWVFNHPFYLLLNLAIGGVWAGPPDASTHFPAKLVVDYVRVYR
jgi:beta-glucanase (GH16 family)